MLFQLAPRPTAPFPDPALAETEPNGLLAVGGDLSPQRLRNAYRLGIFPWYSAGQPILWWSPDPRLVLFPDRLRISRSLRKTLRHPSGVLPPVREHFTLCRCGQSRNKPFCGGQHALAGFEDGSP